MKAEEGREARARDKTLARKLERVEKSRNSWHDMAKDLLKENDELRAQISDDGDEPWEHHCRKILGRVWGERHRQEAMYGHINDKLENGTGPAVDWLLPVSPRRADEIQEDFREAYEAYEVKHGLPTWRHLIAEEVAEAFQEDDPERLAEELIQVAALCVSWVERLTKEKSA